eukprot:11862813-Alexandrium_andersonii.AAC.1
MCIRDRAVVFRGREEFPSQAGNAITSEQLSKRLPGQVLSIEKPAQLRSAQAPTNKAVRAAEEERALGGAYATQP